jgi:hypothetical protein
MINDTVKGIIEEVGLRVYSPSPQEDALLLTWYCTLGMNGDLQKVFPSSAQSLSAFFSFFRPPRILLTIPKDDSLQLAFWLDPIDELRAFSGCWLAEKVRHHKGAFRALQACYSIAFSRFSVLIGFTKQFDLLKTHEKMGYSVVGEINRGWDGVEKAWIVSFTREAFEVSKMNPQLQ